MPAILDRPTVAPAETRWLSTRELGAALRISRTTIGDLIRAGVLRPGDHFIRAGLGQGVQRWDLAAVEAAMREDARAELELCTELEREQAQS